MTTYFLGILALALLSPDYERAGILVESRAAEAWHGLPPGALVGVAWVETRMHRGLVGRDGEVSPWQGLPPCGRCDGMEAGRRLKAWYRLRGTWEGAIRSFNCGNAKPGTADAPAVATPTRALAASTRRRVES